MSASRFVAPACVIVLLFLTLISTTDNDIIAGQEIEFMNGVSFVAPKNELKEQPFNEVVEINANWVAIMPYAFSDGNKPGVHFDHDRQWWGERREGVIRTIALAKAKNLKIFLKPHVWVRGQGWTGDFNLATEEEWKSWEENYENYILTFAKLADSLEVEAFCVGLEYKKPAVERPEFWLNLIKKVRARYSGKVTYAANWDNYQNIMFWDRVDFIGINAYFPLMQEATPEVNLLMKAWAKDKSALMSLSKKYRKPIAFTEFGYRSIDKGAGNQWELESHRKNQEAPNYQVQQNAYQALFESFWAEEWFLGGFLWKWYPDYNDSPENTDYTPQNKPAENVIRSWYKKRPMQSQLN